MSVQVMQVRFPGLLVAVSVERPQRRKKKRPPESTPAWAGREYVAQRFPPITGIESNLIKLQA
jgi:hypothetical protein